MININPDNVKARFKRAKATLDLGLEDATYKDSTTATSFDPGDKEVKIEL